MVICADDPFSQTRNSKPSTLAINRTLRKLSFCIFPLMNISTHFLESSGNICCGYKNLTVYSLQKPCRFQPNAICSAIQQKHHNCCQDLPSTVTGDILSNYLPHHFIYTPVYVDTSRTAAQILSFTYNHNLQSTPDDLIATTSHKFLFSSLLVLCRTKLITLLLSLVIIFGSCSLCRGS